MDLADINRLFADQAQETPILEFKAGDALGRETLQRAEMVKDVSGMANGAGGRLIYGVEEGKNNGITVATGAWPVTDDKITPEWIGQVLRSNSSPPLQGFAVEQIAWPGGGRIVVVDIPQGTTAHQSLLDRKYYQRVGTSTEAMVDFQIRDVMNRRTGPVIHLSLRKVVELHTPNFHRYCFTPCISNEGSVTLERWLLELDFPSFAYDVAENKGTMFPPRTVNIQGIPYERIEFAAHAAVQANAHEVHPGQSIALGSGAGLPEHRLFVSNANHGNLVLNQPPLRWRLFMPNARPLVGSMPFAEWCDF